MNVTHRPYTNTKLSILTLWCSALMLLSPMAAWSNDGASLFGKRLCITCHGAEGKSPIIGTYPKLAGQSKDYLVQQFTDIQSGARNNAQAAVMQGIVSPVTAEEIDTIATYLSQLE